MLDARPDKPGRRRRFAASTAAAAIAGVALAPALATAPAAADPTCQAVLPYSASASADLLKLSALDLRPLGLGVGPLADVSIATTGSGLATAAEVGSAAAARDVAANLLGLDAIGLVPIGELGQTVTQEAPPDNSDPATHTGLSLDLGVATAEVGDISAHATWDQGMRCGAATGTNSQASASLLDASVLPGPGDRALVRLPENLSSRTETGLVADGGRAAARAESAASLLDVRLLAGSPAETSIKVISEPSLEVVSTGAAESSTVSYHAPVLEISGPNVPTERLDAPGSHFDVAIPSGPGPITGLVGSLPVLGDLPLDELLGGVDTQGLDALSTGQGPVEPPLELANLPGLDGGQLPLLGDIAGVGDLLPGLEQLSVLRVSIGDLQQEVTDGLVTASAASLRVQVLSWDGNQLTEQARGEAVIDLGIGLLEAAAAAPAPPEQPGPADPEEPGQGGGCGDCEEGDTLPVTGSTAGMILGTGTLLVVAGGFLLVISRRGGLTTG